MGFQHRSSKCARLLAKINMIQQQRPASPNNKIPIGLAGALLRIRFRYRTIAAAIIKPEDNTGILQNKHCTRKPRDGSGIPIALPKSDPRQRKHFAGVEYTEKGDLPNQKAANTMQAAWTVCSTSVFTHSVTYLAAEKVFNKNR